MFSEFDKFVLSCIDDCVESRKTVICPRCNKNPKDAEAPYCDDCNWQIQKQDERNDSGV